MKVHFYDNLAMTIWTTRERGDFSLDIDAKLYRRFKAAEKEFNKVNDIIREMRIQQRAALSDQHHPESEGRTK